MAWRSASSSLFGNAARAWLAGISAALGVVLFPACAQATVHHASTHRLVEHHDVLHVAARHESFAHHALPVHRLAWNTHHSAARHYTRLARYTHETHYVHLARYTHETHYMHLAAEYRYSRLQCVPYAREVSHIDLSGDAFLWWAEASGRYARGNTPVVGAVLNFRSIGRMPLGHVAVVTAVLNPRTILVTQANWVPGSITNDVTVQDVSPDNNWTDVRVELGDSATMGAAYPTYGFIYNRPAIGTVIASANGVGNEVAEAPQARPVASEAPDRNLQ